MEFISIDEMRALEANADYFGVSYGQMMENAGRKAAESIIARHKKCRVLVVCGTGNNGGDGFVVARLLHEAGYAVLVVLLGRVGQVKEGPALTNAGIAREMGIPVVEAITPDELPKEAFDECDLIADAVLGTGFRGVAREPARTAIRLMNESKAPKVSLDVPSGLDADTGECTECVRPDLVVTFHAPKKGLERYRVEVADIGIPPKASAYVGPGDLGNMRIRGDVSHKGHSGGKVLVIGGGPYVGSPAHAAFAALRTGADVVSVAAPRRAADIIASYSPDLIVWPMGDRDMIVEEDVDRLRPLVESSETVVIGMGMGVDPRTQSAIKKLLPYCGKVVMDASALIPGYPLKGIITPHHSEFRKISGVNPTADPRENAAMAREFSAKNGVVTVIKGPVDVISDGSRTKYNDTGNPGMTVSGTGDVMAGVIGSLYCKNPAFEAACSGSFLCGAAGDMAFDDKGFGMAASDIVGMIPYVLKKHHPAYGRWRK